MNINRKSTSLLTLVFTIALALFFGGVARAETPGSATPPGSAQTPEQPKPGAEQTPPAPKARKEDTEPTTLADAKAALKSARTERDTAEAERAQAVSERDAARAENTRLTEQFAAATTAATAAQAERDSARTERATAIQERDNAQASLATANANVSRLEQLCGVKGVPPKSAVPLVGEEAGESPRDILLAQFRAEKDPTKRAALAAKMRELKD